MKLARTITHAALAATLAAACGTGVPSEPVFAKASPSGSSLLAGNGLSVNGLSSNGLSSNGLSSNGLSSNGLSANGLSSNGLLSSTFSAWWNLNATPGYPDMVMTYVVKCALPSGQSLSWTDPLGTVHYWAGNLGLAPAWASGLPISAMEKQTITACLAAHANKFGVHIDLSVLGLDSLGNPIPQAFDELTTYAQREGAFFGDLFDAGGIYACADAELEDFRSSNRACALNNRSGQLQPCPQITYVGQCSSVCRRESDSAPYWTSCSWNGVTYRPLTTHIKTSDINVCGDNVCQLSEVAGSTNSWWACQDCH